MTSTNKPVAKKAAAPKLTAAMRKAQREEATKLAAALKETAQAVFEKERPAIWNRLFAKALQLELTLRDRPGLSGDFRRDHWWFEAFAVDPLAETFEVPETHGVPLNQAGLGLHNARLVESSLADGFLAIASHFAELQRKAEEEAERQRQYQEALSRVSLEDREILGIR